MTELREGIWLGHAGQSNDTIVGTSEGVVRAYDVRRKAEGRRWNSDKIKNMRGTPQQPDPSKPGMMIPMKVRFDKASEQDPTGDTEVHDTETRRMRITQDVLSKYGYMDGCEGCETKRAGLAISKNHSDDCRSRIMQAMDGDEGGRRAKVANDERINIRLVVREEPKFTQKDPLEQSIIPRGRRVCPAVAPGH